MKRTILCIFVLLISASLYAQNRVPVKNPSFESGATDWILSSTTPAPITNVSSIPVRSGKYSSPPIKVTGTVDSPPPTGTPLASLRIESDDTPFTIPNGFYVHVITWAKGDEHFANSLASPGFAWKSGKTGVSYTGKPITNTSFTQITKSFKATADWTALISLVVQCTKKDSTVNVFFDDVVAYITPATNITDITPPDAPTNVTVTSDVNTITIKWSDGLDTGTIALDGTTGVQEAVILRTDGLNKTAPKLLDQVLYSAAGGDNTPNAVDTWKVVGVVNAGVQTFTDNTAPNGKYTYAVYMRDLAYNYSAGKEGDVTFVSVENETIPNSFKLSQNYPNPFNPNTKITFEIPERSFVELKIYDLRGAEIQTLFKKEYSPGIYSFDFDGSLLSSGIYFYQLITSNRVQTKKMLLIK